MTNSSAVNRRRGWLASSGLVVAIVTIAALGGNAQQQPGAKPNAAVERGKYLVGITGCHDCHSPKIKGMTPDMDRALSGRPTTTPLPSKTDSEVHAAPDLTAWWGPWGWSVASNLTPDPDTGISKRYTEASFLATMRTGKKPNGTQIQPPMPSEVYQHMTDEDLKAIYAYLGTLKPIRNPVLAGLPPPVPAPAPGK